MFVDLNTEIQEFIPEYMRNDPDFQRLIALYTSILNESFELSNDTIQAKMVDSLAEKFKQTGAERYSAFREDILRTALNELFYTADDAINSGVLYDKLNDVYKRLGLPTAKLDLIKALDDILTQQNIIVNKSFNLNKGKYSGYMYISNLMDLVMAGTPGNENTGYLKLIEGNRDNPKEPFNYRVETSHYRETYEELIKPMVHPLGFGYTVATILFLLLEDYFCLRLEQTLEYAELRCLQEDGTYTTKNLLEEYNLEKFSEHEREDGSRRFVLQVKDKDTDENLKFVADYDNSVTLYGIDNMKLIDVELRNPEWGIVNANYDARGNFIDLEYNQYFINRRKQIEFMFKIKGDNKQKEYTAYVLIDPDSLKKVEGNNYLEPLKLTAQDLIERATEEILGYTIEEYPRSCGLHYSIKREYISTLVEELVFNQDHRFEDWFPRRNKYTETLYLVGAAYNPKADPAIWEPLVDSHIVGDGVSYRVGKGKDYASKPFIWDSRVDEHLVGMPHEIKILALNPDYRDQELPVFDFLGKDNEYWLHKQPIYNNYINETMMGADPDKYQDDEDIEYNPCWDFDFHKLTFWPGSSFKGYALKFVDKYVDDKRLIGETSRYTMTEIQKILDGDGELTKGAIRDIVGYDIETLSSTKGWSLDFKDKVLNDTRTIGNTSRYTDNEINKILNGDMSLTRGDIRDIVAWDISLKKNDIKGDWYLEKTINVVGEEGRVIGDEYSDEDILKIRNKDKYPTKGPVRYIGRSLTPKIGIDIKAEYYDYELADDFDIVGISSFSDKYDDYYKVDEYFYVEAPFKMVDYFFGEIKLIGEEDLIVGSDRIIGGDDREIQEPDKWTVTFYPGSDLYDWFYIYTERNVSSRNVGNDDRYTDEEIEQILNHELYPSKGAITDKVGDYYIDGGWTNEDFYLKYENNLVGSNYKIGRNITDDELRLMVAHKARFDSPAVRHLGMFARPVRKGDRLAEYWNYEVNEDFLITCPFIFSDKYNYKINEFFNITTPTKITDEYYEGTAVIGEEGLIVGSERIIGEITESIKTDLDFNIAQGERNWYLRRKISYVGEGRIIGDNYDDSKLDYYINERIEPQQGDIKFIGYYYKKELKTISAEYYARDIEEDLVFDIRKRLDFTLEDKTPEFRDSMSISMRSVPQEDILFNTIDDEMIMNTSIIGEDTYEVQKDQIEFTIINK